MIEDNTQNKTNHDYFRMNSEKSLGKTTNREKNRKKKLVENMVCAKEKQRLRDKHINAK